MKVNRILAGRRLTIYPALRFKNTNFMNLDLSFEDREQQQQANQRRLSCKEDISQPKKKTSTLMCIHQYQIPKISSLI